MPNMTGLRLSFPDDRPEATTLEAVNASLGEVGAKLWAIDLTAAPQKVRDLVAKPVLNEDESAQVMAHFLMPRERLLEVIAEAGRTPQVADGGELSTYVTPHNYSYPQLFVVSEGVDYSRFDRLHVNIADDGKGVDEFMTVLCGSGVRLLQRMPDGGMLTLYVDCPNVDTGWLITYDGIYPHVGSISGASSGAKILMQVIGPPVWTMRYEDEL